MCVDRSSDGQSEPKLLFRWCCARLSQHICIRKTFQAAMDLFKQLSDGVKAGVDMTQGAVKGAVGLVQAGNRWCDGPH